MHKEPASHPGKKKFLGHKKIISFDLDGTIAVSKSPTTVQMAELLKSLVKEKIVVVASGGKFELFEKNFLPLFDTEFLKEHGTNLILLPTNGSQRYQYDKSMGKWILTDKEPLPAEIKAKAKKVLEEVISSGLYDIPSNPDGEIIEDRDTQISLSALGQLAPIERKSAWDPDQKKRQKIKAAIEPKLPEATVAVAGTTTIDITQKGFNKAVGLKRLLEKLQLEKSDMLYIGDALFPGGNDYSVFEAGIQSIKVDGPEETAEVIKNLLASPK